MGSDGHAWAPPFWRLFLIIHFVSADSGPRIFRVFPRDTGGPRGAILPPRRPCDPLGRTDARQVKLYPLRHTRVDRPQGPTPCCPAAIQCVLPWGDKGWRVLSPLPGKCASEKVLSCLPHLSLDSTVRHNPPCIACPHTHSREEHATRTCSLQPHTSHTSRTCGHTPHAPVDPHAPNTPAPHAQSAATHLTHLQQSKPAGSGQGKRSTST